MAGRKHGRRGGVPQQRSRRWVPPPVVVKPVLARAVYGWRPSGFFDLPAPEPCPKVCFDSAADANPSFMQRAYRCTDCGWYHLTHR
jgi:hypothetical protein